MFKRPVLTRLLLLTAIFSLSAFSATPSFSQKEERVTGQGSSGDEPRSHGAITSRKHGKSPAKELWRKEKALDVPVQEQESSVRKLVSNSPAVPIASGALGRSSIVINEACQILFTRTCPTGAPGCPLPACDPTLVGSPPTFRPTDFVGCEPLRLVVRNSTGIENVIATEGENLPAPDVGLRLAGWGEFYDMNNAGIAAFKAAISGAPLVDETGANESGVGLFTAGVGSPLTKIIQSGTIVGGRRICGIAPMVSINDAGQIAFEGYSAIGPTCSERGKGIFRFTPGPGVELLFALGTDVGAGVTVTRFEPDPVDTGDTLDLNMNSLGQIVVPVRLSDGDDAIYRLNGPGSFTEVARSGNAGPGGIFDRVAARPDLNNSGQVLFKAAIGGDGSPSTHNDGVDSLILFTPPSTYQVIAQSGGAIPGLPGQTFQGFASFFDLNNNGDAVFKADVVLSPAVPGFDERSSPCPPPAPPASPLRPPLAARGGCGVAGLYLWNRTTTTVSEVARTGPQFFGFFPPVLAVNDARRVVFGTRSATAIPIDRDIVERSLYSWTAPGPPVKLLEIGDLLDGVAVTSIFAQHLPFERQLAENGSFASAAYIGNQDPDDGTERTHNGKLFAVFAVACPGQLPTPTPTPTVPGPTPTSTPIPGAPPSDIPTLTPWLLVLFGLALATVAFFVIRRF